MDALELANKLGDIRDQIARLESEKAEVEEALLFQMKANGIKNVKTDYGESISRVWKTTYKVLDKALALKWAGDKNALKTDIDTKKFNAILSKEKKLPKFIEKVESDYLRMTKPNEAINE